ncbi:Zn(2)-Cys(6) binuclear cluster domain-containing protein [Mycena metata]|uniref:Zn(2)-Cys(6) binuclear cluster domain-containing protein n=1 Tax=Mycena metata TaxID=1033252 RepID=A0AAD7MW56_9AGAR|nr:Zn(2)-Cys(6) binuclear cluster domain-containing protein [Mycena metata]
MDQETFSRKPQLNKGKACFNCRQRKVKCDAKKPICTPCGRFVGGGLQDCEYTERGPAQSQILQEQISILESRIRDMERPRDMRMSVGLQNPYPASRLSISDPATNVAPGESTFSFAHIPRGTPALAAAFTGRKSPSREFSQALISSFFPYARQVGFFLSSQLFEALSSGTAPTDVASPALLDTIYLWGAHLSKLDTHQPRFLSDALRSTAAGLLHAHSPNAILHTIQAELLLAQYFFHNSRILEGKYHVSAAVSIALSSGLHKIRSADVRDSVRSMVDALSPAATALEEGERINAFWAVFVVDTYWLAADGSPADITYAVVDTPWPLDIGEYSEDSRALPVQSSGTIDNFLANFPDRGISVPALHAKAAIIFEQASRLAARYTENVEARASTAMLSAEFSRLDGVIEAFKTTLTPLDSSGSQSQSSLLIRTLAHVATIQLHNPFIFTSEVSCTRSRAAAMAVVALVRQTNLHELGYLDAIMGTLWTAACQVFITELSRAQYGHDLGPNEVRNIQQLGEAIETLLSAMSVFSGGCRMIELQLATAQRNYAAARKR